MADLPMAQLPQFGVNQPGIPYQGNFGSGLAAGISQGAEMSQRQYALAMEQKKLEMEKINQHIAIVDSLTKNAIEYPTLMKSFWPAIAKSMSAINPDFNFDPNKPPQDLGGLYKFLSETHDAHVNGVINGSQAETILKQRIPDFNSQAVPSGAVGEITQPQPSLMLPGQQGYEEKLAQLLSMGPTHAKAGLPLLEATPEALQMKNELEKQKQLEINKQTQTYENLRKSADESTKYMESIQPHIKQVTAYNDLLRTIKSGEHTPLAQLKILNKALQTINPNINEDVNADNYSKIASTRGLPGWFVRGFTNIFKGKGLLPEEVDSLFDMAKSSHDNAIQAAHGIHVGTKKLISALGQNPDNMLTSIEDLTGSVPQSEDAMSQVAAFKAKLQKQTSGGKTILHALATLANPLQQ